MLALFELLWSGHLHKWIIIKESRYDWSNDLGECGSGTKYILQCTVCGNIKRKICR